MDTDTAILVTVILIASLIIFRILSLRKWMKLSLEMQKESGAKFDPSGTSFSDFRRRQKQVRSTQQHKIALRNAKNPK